MNLPVRCVEVGNMRDDEDEGRLGDLAEEEFSLLARKAGILAHPPKKDRRGWDFFLEFPEPTSGERGLLGDVTPSASSKVQVKGTRRSRKPSISLRNWRRMVEDPLPYFIFVALFDDGDGIVETHLVHVDRSCTEKTLERLFQSPDSFDGGEMSVTLNKDDRIDFTEAENLLAALKRHIGDDQFSYLKEKKQWLDTVGVPEKPLRGTFTFGTLSPERWSLMADFAIGELEELPLESIELRHARFGVERPLEGAEDGNSEEKPRIQLPNLEPRDTVEVALSNRDRTIFLSVTCDAFHAASVFPFLPKEYRKARLVHGPISLVLSPADEGFHVRFGLAPLEGENVTTLGRLRQATKLAMIVIESPTNPPTISVGKTPPTEFKVPDPNSCLSADQRYFYYLSERLVTVLAAFATGDDARLELSALDDHVEELEVMAAALNGESMSPTFSFKGVKYNGDRAAMIVCPSIPVGPDIVAACISMSGPAEIRTKEGCIQVKIPSARLRVEQKWQMPKDQWLKFDTSVVVQAARKRLDGEGFSLVLVEELPQENDR